jgi:hypothetical protein
MNCQTLLWPERNQRRVNPAITEAQVTGAFLDVTMAIASTVVPSVRIETVPDVASYAGRPLE